MNYLPKDDFCDVLVRVHQAYVPLKAELQNTETPPPVTTAVPFSESSMNGTIRSETASEIANNMMEIADTVHGGYGPDHKFPHPEANEFLLYRYQSTGNKAYLDHVARTLMNMRDSATYDAKDGGYFRYSSKADWSEPHPEKLLADHAGLLKNFLRMYVLTDDDRYKTLAQEIVTYLNTHLFDESKGAFLGCQDYVRVATKKVVGGRTVTIRDPKNTFAIIDDWIYTDANAQVVSAYLEASWVGSPDCRIKALHTLEYLWEHCRSEDGEMFHYRDGEGHAPGLLVDALHVGLAMLDAYRFTGDSLYLDRAQAVGEDVLAKYANPSGGFFDISHTGPANMQYPLTLLADNGLAASFLLKLSDATKDTRYRRAAQWALGAFTDDLSPYGVYASLFGQTLAEYTSEPLKVTIEGRGDDSATRKLYRAALAGLGGYRLTVTPIILNNNAKPSLYIENDVGRVGPVYDAGGVGPELVASLIEST